MRKYLAAVCLSSLVAFPLFSAQPSHPFVQNDEPLPFKTNNPRADVMVAYARISGQIGVNRSRMFDRLPPMMQADLWVLHLDFFVQDHEELTIRQRAVVYQAVRFIENDAFNTTPTEEARQARVATPLKSLVQRAIAEFGPALAYEAFGHLGPPDPYSTLGKLQGIAIPGVVQEAGVVARPSGTPLPDCECSTDSDLCCLGDCPTSSTPTCHRNIDKCTPTTGCGWFWLSSCNGTCGA